MTATHGATDIDRTARGWLRHAWEQGLADEPTPGPAHCGEDRGYLLRSAVPETIEPFISRKPAPGLDEGDTRIVDFVGLDSPAAAALLAELPPRSLELDFSMYPPSTGTMLRVIAENPGTILGDGSVFSPQLPAEAVRLRGLRILDPSLLDVAPDVVPGDLPTWIDDLPEDRYAQYLQDRHWCLSHGVTRPAWVAAVVRYGIHDARRYPHMSLLTDDSGAGIGVRFRW